MSQGGIAADDQSMYSFNRTGAAIYLHCWWGSDPSCELALITSSGAHEIEKHPHKVGEVLSHISQFKICDGTRRFLH